MGRNPRIEFGGAVYHVMSRGNRQEPVFLDDTDCRVFIDALEEACGRCGWRIHAFALMGNHYHLLLETPEANLVDGMRWLQGTYTKRFNGRHKQWGHLFQGRYKALLVDCDGDYFGTVCDYIHLNPARAKCFDLEEGRLADYKWSSFPLYLRPSRRPAWLSVDRSLGRFGLMDDRSGRTLYRQLLQKRVVEIACSAKPWEVDEAWAKIRRGWCFGSGEFRDRMTELLDGVMAGKRRDSFVGEETARHDMLEAERLLEVGLGNMGLSEADLAGLRKNDPRKRAVAWLVRKQTSVRNEWISKRLHMGNVSKLSSFVKSMEDSRSGELFRLKKRVAQRKKV